MPAPQPDADADAPTVARGGRRVGAFLVDVFVMVVMLFMVAILVMAIHEANTGIDWDSLSEAEQDQLMGSIFGIWGIGYFLGTWALNATGASLGKRIFDLRIVREDLKSPGIGVGLGRTFAAWLSWPVVGLGFLWGFWDDRAQTWHDKMAATYVVRRDSLPRPNRVAAPYVDRGPGSGSLH